MKSFVLLSLVFGLLNTQSFAMSLKGVDFADKTNVGAEELTLNGLGLRLATIFNVKVYVGALYVKNKNNDAQKIMSDPGAKQIVMHFVRKVDREDLIEGFKKGFENNDISYEANKEKWDQFFMPLQNVVEGDRVIITISPETLEMDFKGKKSKLEKFTPATEFVKLWLGKAPNSELKEGMLGIVQ